MYYAMRLQYVCPALAIILSLLVCTNVGAGEQDAGELLKERRAAADSKARAALDVMRSCLSKTAELTGTYPDIFPSSCVPEDRENLLFSYARLTPGSYSLTVMHRQGNMAYEAYRDQIYKRKLPEDLQ